MLAIFDTYDDATRELIQSLTAAGIGFTPLVIRYDGELPEGALCPFTAHLGLPRTGVPLFFNEVPVPAWCEIRQGSEPYGEILRDGSLLGRIHYDPNSFRQVQRVDWLLPDRTRGHSDHYDRYGSRYATTHYSADVAYQTVYRYDGGEPGRSIEVDHATRVVTLRTPDRLLTYDTLTDFVSAFIDEQGLLADPDGRVLINSLSYPLFVLRKRAGRHPDAAPRAVLFWQEPMPGDVPGNMVLELEQPVALSGIVFCDERLRRRVADGHPDTALDLGYLSHLGQFAGHQGYDPRRVFTLTNSDELPGLADLLDAFPEVTFSVAALTLMSDRLHDLGRRHPNLTLTPRISHQQIGEELRRASVYLDINAGAHVLDVVKAAYYLDLVVLALAPLAKAPDHARVLADAEDLRAALDAVVASPEGRARALDALHTQRGPLSSPADYRRVLGGRD